MTWQEFSGLEGVDQIYSVRPIGPGAANCDGVKPAGVPVEGHVPAIGGICWQQTGIPRVGEDPSLNVDTAREGVEPDIAFTGANDGVPWIVWYEKGKGTTGLHENEMVFAAKGVSDGEAANGGFHWVVVGQALSATLDTSGANKIGKCAESAPVEARCSLNKDTNGDAENPRVAAGTMNPANPTSPWITWDEEVGGVKQVFVSHLVGSGCGSALRNRQRRRPDLDRDGRLDAARHHVLGQHAVRDVARGGRRGVEGLHRPLREPGARSCSTRATSR